MKIKFTVLVVGALFLPVSHAAVEGERSTLQFTGKIVESTCSLDTSSDKQRIDLGTVSANVFKGANSHSEQQAFTIELNDCSTSAYSNATLTFRGDTINSNTELNVTGGATNLGLQILENGTPLAMDGSSSTADKTLVNGTNIFDLTTRYIALDNTVGVGAANASVNFMVEYH
ncbi:fimbrial family protein [Enterobacteriaceae bacterium ATCC 29904]|nr:fimbrial family protein [Enterobacteriaceae bacterium ATCC 29904]